MAFKKFGDAQPIGKVIVAEDIDVGSVARKLKEVKVRVSKLAVAVGAVDVVEALREAEHMPEVDVDEPVVELVQAVKEETDKK